MYILSLDPSTKQTGYAVYQDQELVEYGCWSAGSANVFKRIDKMVSELDAILKKYSFDKVFCEDVYPEDVHNNIQIYKVLTYLQGFLLHKLDEYNLKPIFFTPSEWRKKCGIHTGRGVRRDSLKPKDVAFVKAQFDIDVNDDVADGIAIGFAGIGGVLKTPLMADEPKNFDDFEFL